MTGTSGDFMTVAHVKFSHVLNAESERSYDPTAKNQIRELCSSL